MFTSPQYPLINNVKANAPMACEINSFNLAHLENCYDKVISLNPLIRPFIPVSVTFSSLNINAKPFSPQAKVLLPVQVRNIEPLVVPTLNACAPPFIMNNIDSPVNYVLNPYADIFIPLEHNISDEDLSPRKLLKKIKLENANKISCWTFEYKFY